jgi:hypothetical protein
VCTRGSGTSRGFSSPISPDAHGHTRAQVTLSQASRCRSGGLTSRYTEGRASEAESLVPPQTYAQAPITVKFMKHITSSAYS